MVWWIAGAFALGMFVGAFIWNAILNRAAENAFRSFFGW
jgi:hypothetical protein